MKKTLVISAFPCCGKTYFTENHEDKDLVVLDSDSSNFSWIKDEHGQNTTDRDPSFPANYMAHIKENIGKADIIFVSSHANVREAMAEAGISYVTVYPLKQCKDEWIRRMESRGSADSFIKFISDNWDKFIDQVDEEPHGDLMVFISDQVYLDADFIERTRTNLGNIPMKEYIGTKSVKALPEIRDGSEGYKVQYPDGYVSWSPKDVFEGSYRHSGEFNFGHALELLKQGCHLARKGWNGVGMFVVYQKGYPQGIPCNKQTAEAWGMTEGELFRCEPYLQIKMVTGSHAMWVPSINDVLAEDWEIVK